MRKFFQTFGIVAVVGGLEMLLWDPSCGIPPVVLAAQVFLGALAGWFLAPIWQR